MFYFDETELNEPAAVGGTITSGKTSEKSHHTKQPLKQGRERHPATKMPLPTPKPTFHDLYLLHNDDLGSGAYATVRTAVNRATGKEYAVKLVDKHEQGHTRSRIAREIDIFTMCKGHPNIVQLIESFEDDDYCYMVFEKMRGGALLSRIQQKGMFTEQEASMVTRDIAKALQYLHSKGIAHRDVKPENILCTEPDRVSPVKLCDLDLASKPVTPKKSKRGLHVVQSEPSLASPVGSAEFMAPEVVDAFVGDAFKYDRRCDTWSLGVIIYIMLCGYPPFYGECDRGDCGWDQGKPCADCQENLFHRIQRGEYQFPEEEWGSISDEAKDLIARLLVRDVRRRYTSDDVLRHPWVKNGAPRATVLQTPANLCRNDSTRDIQQRNEHFNVLNRFTDTCCLNLGSDGSEVSSSDSGSGSGPGSAAGTPERIDSPVDSLQSHVLEDVKTPMPPMVTAVEAMEQMEAPSPPLVYMDQQQLIAHNGVLYCAPPALCSYPMQMGPVPPSMYIGGACPSMMTPLGCPPTMNAQGQLQHQLLYPPPTAFCYYVVPPPTDVNA